MSETPKPDRTGTDRSAPGHAGASQAVNARASAAGLALSERDLVAVADFLGGLAPGLAALADVSRQLGDGPPVRRGSRPSGVEAQ